MNLPSDRHNRGDHVPHDLSVGPFILYAEASVEYDGRAYSTLCRGNYLIVRKEDGSIMIHGSTLVKPLNYMGSGSTILTTPGTMIIARKNEKVKISIHRVHQLIIPELWSDNKIEISKTESELTEKIAREPNKYLNVDGPCYLSREYSTSAGPVDLVVVCRDIYVIEVKRKQIRLTDCYQVHRYLDAIMKDHLVIKHAFGLGPSHHCKIIGCLAGPAISRTANKHCEDKGFRYLTVDF